MPVVFRRRDRIKLEVPRIWRDGDYVRAEVRNRGGTPTTIAKVVGGGWSTSSAYPPIPGPGTVTIETTIEAMAVQPAGSVDLYVEDSYGNRSNVIRVPAEVVEAVAEHRRITRG